MTNVHDVECPAQTCGAGPGEPCLTSGGVERFEPHGLRWLYTFPGPLVRCPDGPCAACRYTGWVPEQAAPRSAPRATLPVMTNNTEQRQLIATAAELIALPHRTILRNVAGGAAQVYRDDEAHRLYFAATEDFYKLPDEADEALAGYGPFTVLYEPE